MPEKAIRLQAEPISPTTYRIIIPTTAQNPVLHAVTIQYYTGDTADNHYFTLEVRDRDTVCYRVAFGTPGAIGATRYYTLGPAHQASDPDEETTQAKATPIPIPNQGEIRVIHSTISPGATTNNVQAIITTD